MGWILLMPLSRLLNPLNWSFWNFLTFFLALFGAAVSAQTYRYRRVSTPIQRQQTKWFVFGLAAMFGIYVIYNFDIPGLLLPALRQPGLTHLVYNLASLPFVLAILLLPYLTILLGILRYRLWDIDLIIRRSLIYGSLTVTLVLIYFSSVVFLQSLVNRLTMQSQNGLVR
jgi:hypothetical protein